jgi:hypothetical protein
MNRTRNIDDLKVWKVAKDYLTDHNYSVFQFWGEVNEVGGFHARFISSQYDDVEIVTKDPIVRDEIIEFNGRGMNNKRG